MDEEGVTGDDVSDREEGIAGDEALMGLVAGVEFEGTRTICEGRVTWSTCDGCEGCGGCEGCEGCEGKGLDAFGDWGVRDAGG